MARKVAIYTRISRDDEGEGLGVARQREDCERLVDLRGWSLAKIYEDNDVSAYKRNVRRPEFELMLSDLASGLIDGVVSYDLDRLARQPKDLERVIDVFDSRKRLTFATVTNDIDLSAADGRTMARVMVAFANKASHDSSRRIRRKHLELAMSGKSSGGPAPYGWQKDDPNKVDREAASHIRAAQKEILAGVRIGTIRRRWHEERLGHPREGTKRIAHHHLEHMLTNPRLCGYRTYHGEILLNDNGEPVTGEWETINTVKEWEAVCAAVAERKKGGTGAGRPVGRKYLLSGIARCGLCHTKIRGQINQRWQPGSKASKYSYQCSVVNGGCGKVGRVGEPVEDLIIDLVLEEQRKKAAEDGSPVEVRWPGEAEFQTVSDDIKALTAAANAREITVSSLLQVLPDLERRRDELKLERARFLRELKRAESIAEGIKNREDFRDLPIERQQSIILHSLSAVSIHPAGRGRRIFDPDLIEPIWRE
ncbi:recombinase family protein [Streptomyces sp. BH-SS-21]|uniref:Recombinase family protein n=1 Tax=Streptomyces liliiviolaceus TaxID=2823109 RepID=A0A941BC43_9ACTN|nr:recombinase family protein [Streptomyces liliiviolaceus]MBQ0848009.1 recombinase family protein [Streptomyces liliiviolaceus]